MTKDNPASPQGRVVHPRNRGELESVVDLAFDYRGDVTVSLTDGNQLVGYISNRDAVDAGGWLEIWPKELDKPMRLAYAAIAGIAFTGTDTAAGKTWDAWLAKVAQAEQSGQLAEIYPEDLDANE